MSEEDGKEENINDIILSDRNRMTIGEYFRNLHLGFTIRIRSRIMAGSMKAETRGKKRLPKNENIIYLTKCTGSLI